MSPSTSLVASLALLCLPLASALPSIATAPRVKPVAPVLLNQAEAQVLLDTYAAVPVARPLDYETDPDLGNLKRHEKRQATATACLGSNTTSLELNTLLYYGQVGTVISLCPGAYILLEQPVYFAHSHQEISTQGYPTDDTRATLAINNNTMSYAIYGACDYCQGVAIRNIQVYGARDTLGYLPGGAALLEMGGNTFGQVIDNCHIWEPRGWSCLHGIEGWHTSCNSIFVTNNQIGPCGNPPNTGHQFKRDTDQWTTPSAYLTNHLPGQWADGVSMACKNSTITGNTITDATDGGIVIFQAPGSTISGNTIISKNRVLMGGINAVDFGPFNGPYTGTVVSGNTLISESTMMKTGIAIGGMVWGSDNRTAGYTWDGVFNDNTFKSGPNGYFGYAIAVAGHTTATVLGNDASGANFGGQFSSSCIPSPRVPTSQAFVYDQYTTKGSVLQTDFVNFPLVFLICQEPGPIVGTGSAAPLNAVVGVAASPSSSTTVAATTTTSQAPVAVAPSSSAAASSSSDAAAPITSAPAATTTQSLTPHQASLLSRKAAAKAASKSAARAAASVASALAKLEAGKAAGKRGVIDLEETIEKREAKPYGPRATPVLSGVLENPFATLERERARQ